MTKEHIFPRWATRLVKGKDPVGSPTEPEQQGYGFRQMGTSMSLDREYEVVDTQPGRPVVSAPHMTVKVVCASCNGGWMSALEVEVAPAISRLMTGQGVKLSKEEARAVIRWAQKTCVMLNCWGPTPALVGGDVLQGLMEGHRKLPGTWHIRLARVTDEEHFSFTHTPLVTKFAVTSEGGHPDREYEQVLGVQSLFALGSVVFIVRYSPYKFVGSMSIDHDLNSPSIPPITLLGPRATRILKPWNWPRFDRADFHYWSLWAVSAPGGLPGLFEQDDGSLAIDEVTTSLDATIVDSGLVRINPAEVFSREPRPPTPSEARSRIVGTQAGMDRVMAEYARDVTERPEA